MIDDIMLGFVIGMFVELVIVMALAKFLVKKPNRDCYNILCSERIRKKGVDRSGKRSR